MKRQLSVLAVIVGIAGVLALSLSSCAIQAVVSATGYVLDSSTGAGISGATVTLTNPGTGTSYSVSPTAADGSYSVPLVAPGQYDVTVSASGYYFPPVSVTLQKGQSAVPTMPGVLLTTTDANAGTISFILTWQNTNAPLDLEMTYPPSDLSNTSDTGFTTPYYDLSTNWSTGFGLDPSNSPGTYRQITNSYYTTGSNSNTSSAYHTITMGATNSSTSGTGGPVAIDMSQFPFVLNTLPSTPFPIAPTTTNGLNAFGLPSNTTFLWYGVGEVYISSSSTTYPVASSDGTSGANPVVYVVQAGYDTSGALTENLLGTFTVPNYTTMPAASVIRVDFFKDSNNTSYYDFLIVPDVGVVPGGGGTNGSNLRSVTTTPSVIAVRAKGK